MLLTPLAPASANNCQMPGEWVGHLEYSQIANTWDIEVESNQPNGGFGFTRTITHWDGTIFPHQQPELFNLYAFTEAVLSDQPTTCESERLNEWRQELKEFDGRFNQHLPIAIIAEQR